MCMSLFDEVKRLELHAERLAIYLNSWPQTLLSVSKRVFGECSDVVLVWTLSVSIPEG